MRLFILVILGVVLLQSPLLAGSSKPEILLGVFVQHTDNVADPSKTVAFQLQNPDETVVFNKLPVVTQVYLWDMQPMSDGSVIVQFDAIGTNAIEAATRTNMGKIFAVIVNGRVVLSATIDQPLVGGKLRLYGLTPEELKNMATFIKKRKAT